MSADSFQVGAEIRGYINTGTHASETLVEIKNTDAFNEKRGKTKIKLDIKASKNSKTFGGQKEEGYAFKYFKKQGANDAVFNDLEDSHDNNTPIEFYFADGPIGTTGTTARRCYCIVTKLDRKGEINGMVEYEVEADHTYYEESNAIIEPDTIEI